MQVWFKFNNSIYYAFKGGVYKLNENSKEFQKINC
jgi:hypothetical protein